jgi:hypothetical protein
MSALNSRRAFLYCKIACLSLLFTACVDATAQWQQGFDFRNTKTFVADPSGDVYVLPTTAYPTKGDGVTYGWMKTSVAQGRDRSKSVDPRLAGINFASNGSPATFFVDLPSPGTYNIVLGIGDAGWRECWVQCQVQFLDGSTVLVTVTGGLISAGTFYDATGKAWPGAAWPSGNLSQQVTLMGTRLTMVVGTNQVTGDFTTVPFLGVTQVSEAPSFTLSASPASLSVAPGDEGKSTITATTSNGFDSAISLSAAGAPSGTTVSFDPNPIPAPGAGNSTMTIIVGSTTLPGTYPITVTGTSGGTQQNTTVNLTVGSVSGFDFRNTMAFIGDPSGSTYVLPTTAYPTKGNGFTYGWAKTSLVQGRDRSTSVDPRLAGINFASNGSPATFYVDLPSSGTYNLSLALGDANWGECWVQCEVQFLDGSTVLADVSEGLTNRGYFYDATGKNWSAAEWPSSSLSQRVTLTGTRLTMVVGTDKATGDFTTVAFLGVTQTTGSPNFALSASPASLSIAQGHQGTSTITATLSNGFDSAISLSAAGAPSDTTVSLNPRTISAPGNGSSTMSITVGLSTPVGAYPITITGNGGGIQQNTTVTLTVTAQQQPNFTISASPSSVTVAQGNQGTSTITTMISGGFNNGISLSAAGMPAGMTAGFNPNPIPAPGAGSSTMTITVGSSTPTGSHPITVAGDGGGVQQNATVTVTVTAGGSQGPANGYFGQPYSFTLQSSFGTPPYDYQLTSGSLPLGLVMDQSGNITGTPTATGQFPFEVLVTDSSQPPHQQQTFDYTLSVLVAVASYHNDSYLSGANTNETTLTPSNVNVQTFGKLLSFAVQGYVYAQPLYVPGVNINGVSHNLVFIATEHDQVYAFDVNSGQQIWQTTFLSSNGNLIVSTVSSNDVNCNDLVPEIGITGTPAIDTSTNTLYVVAKTKEYNVQTQQTTFYLTLHALDITTGVDEVPPQRINAMAAGVGTGSINGVLTFDPLVQAQRPGLTIHHGAVFVAFASHGDLGAYHGWVMAFDEKTLAPSGVTVDTPNGYEGGYWGGGSGLAIDSAGSIYGATGNGYFDADRGGEDYGDSIVRLTWSSTSKTFTVVDYFTPWDQLVLDQYDRDLGSGGLLLLPDQPGTQYPHLLLQAGKEGTIDLVNRDNMGQFHSGDDSQIVQTLPHATGSIFGAPAFWNNNVYFGGVNDYLTAFSFDPNAQLLSVNYTSRSPELSKYPGPTPSVSGNSNRNGILWIIQSDTYPGGNAALRAYDATNLATELYNSEQNSRRDRAGLAVKFTTPIVADGFVFVAAENEVDMYGLLQ